MHNYPMWNALARILIFASLLMLSVSQIARAESKLYQYDGKLPFVQMMLNMMATMGIIDRVPNSMINRGSFGSGFPYSGMSSPYARALALRGISPTALGNPYSNNPFSRSPWLQSPLAQRSLSQSGINPLSSVWGNTDWGVLPIESYSLNNSAWDNYGQYSLQGGQYYRNPSWSQDDINGWVNEPWENSAWNPDGKPRAASQQKQQTKTPALVQNFNYNVPPSGSENTKPVPNSKTNNAPYNSSPLAKLAPPSRMRPAQSAQYAVPQQSARQTSPLSKRSRQNTKHIPGSNSRNRPLNNIHQKPCVTDFCGLKKPNLDGLWVAQNGEMLGVKNHRYLWSDSHSRYLTGQLKIQNEYLLANVDDHDRLMRFKYKLAGNHLLTMQDDGTVREFVRMSRNQYQRLTTGGYNSSYGQNFRGYN